MLGSDESLRSSWSEVQHHSCCCYRVSVHRLRVSDSFSPLFACPRSSRNHCHQQQRLTASATHAASAAAAATKTTSRRQQRHNSNIRGAGRSPSSLSLPSSVILSPEEGGRARESERARGGAREEERFLSFACSLQQHQQLLLLLVSTCCRSQAAASVSQLPFLSQLTTSTRFSLSGC